MAKTWRHMVRMDEKEDTSQTDRRKDLFLPADGSEELGM